MKLFYNVPKSEDTQQFYTRYASLVPTLNKLGYLAQIVSALTEAGILYAVVYGSIVPFWPDVAPTTAVAGSAVGTLFLELGLRKFVPFGARAIIHKRYKGWDGWITAFVLAVAAGLIVASGLLSFKGSGLLVESVAPPPETISTTATDSTATAETAAAVALLNDGEAATRARYAALIKAVEQTATADLRQLTGRLRRLEDKEDRTGKSYVTRKAQTRADIDAATAARDKKVAELRTAEADAVAALQSSHRAKLETISKDKRQGRETIAASNDRARAATAARVANYGGGLAYFTLFCLSVFILSVIIQELHRAGAGIEEQIEPGAFDFEAGPFAAFAVAVSGRFNRFIYGLIHRIEQRTTDAPEPVAAPTVWSRDAATLRTNKTQGIRRKIKPTNGRKAPAASAEPGRRQIGFAGRQQPPETQTDASPADNALTDCVKDASQTQPASHEIGVCDHCGSDYRKRTTWQRFCSTQCRKDYHAEKHGGTPYDPTRKPWN
ncbi:hypothetical protein FUA23_06575 [Neolewinella aurantiaca]|uniref:Uncharacterized protein n=1 Tax=Neolewinella aurantiaca TaxID=2602767 RepID=A0A5C7FIQ5_9BACT|nr:hypothetical protein [Neolewinella aurantiaca]TXF90449.1 hypothetical protein FUA23_06575 [Neolewinella aurantiaca]